MQFINQHSRCARCESTGCIVKNGKITACLSCERFATNAEAETVYKFALGQRDELDELDKEAPARMEKELTKTKEIWQPPPEKLVKRNWLWPNVDTPQGREHSRVVVPQ